MGRFMVVTSDKPFEAIVTYDGEYVNDPKDWVRLIRCKDCNHCDETNFCFIWGSNTKPEGFCNFGNNKTLPKTKKQVFEEVFGTSPVKAGFLPQHTPALGLPVEWWGEEYKAQKEDK